MSNDKVVENARSYVRGLIRRRNNRKASADDVQRYLNLKGFRGDVNERLSVVRSVLRTPLRPTGTMKSRRPEARGRSITAWTE